MSAGMLFDSGGELIEVHPLLVYEKVKYLRLRPGSEFISAVVQKIVAGAPSENQILTLEFLARELGYKLAS